MINKELNKTIKEILKYSNKYYKEIDFIKIFENKNNFDIIRLCKEIKKRGYKILTD